ncbi:MAG: glutaredoxin [Benjaminiella poitrasii]|nr:MAG: glutaredoxin [Benjaminiella poitrasii]
MSIVSQGIRDFVQKAIRSNKVMIFSKSYCPYCISVKDLFDDMHVDYKALELNEHENGEAIQNTLAELTKQTTVPNIFINQQHIGGSDSLKSAFASGRLEKLLNDAGIKHSKI